MKKLLNRLYYPVVVILALSIISYFYYDYKKDSIPDSFIVIEGESYPVLERNNIKVSTLKKGENSVNVKLFGLLPLKTVSIDVVDRSMVIPGGIPVGIYIETEGILVIDVVEVADMYGNISIPSESKVCVGDYILEANGIKTASKEDLVEVVNNSMGEDIILKINRNGSISEVKVKPVQTAEKEYKLGIWIRDNTQGVGMLTYISPEGEFGALGHGIYDTDTNELMTLSDGAIYQADILDVIKGKEDSPGELIGSIYYNGLSKIGDISENTDNGIYGTCSVEVAQLPDPVQVGYKQDMELGAAEIYTCVDGELKAYDIKITEIDINANSEEHGFMIEVTDEELLELTGGIVQGMSGSPIIQNGKIVGAVTHVLVNDPTKGYGIFIETMLEECE